MNYLWSLLLDVFFPIQCVQCDNGSRFLCSACIKEVITQTKSIHDPPLHNRSPALASLDALFEITTRSPVYKLVEMLKYDGVTGVLSVFEELIAAVALPKFDGACVIVPVPLHPKREMNRGFDQNLLIAELFAKKLGVPLQKMLIRKRNTPPQATLDQTARTKNLQGAFRIAVPPDSSTTYILVDDICTTGSTISACAEAIAKAGAEKIQALTLAYTAANTVR